MRASPTAFQHTGVFLIVPLTLILAGCTPPRQRPAGVKAELEAMYDSDQGDRARLQEITMKNGLDSPEVREMWRKQRAIDDANVQRLQRIIDEDGWPDPKVVGKNAARAAFLVIQHADYPYQKQYLPVLRAAVAGGKARPDDLAFLEDRVLVREGKKQIYGSQVRQNVNGGTEFDPIEDEEHVDQRRKSVGLPPLAEYGKQFGIDYKPK